MITALITNKGSYSSSYRVRITDCPEGLPAAWSNVESPTKTVSPQHDRKISLDLYGRLSLKEFSCSGKCPGLINEISLDFITFSPLRVNKSLVKNESSDSSYSSYSSYSRFFPSSSFFFFFFYFSLPSLLPSGAVESRQRTGSQQENKSTKNGSLLLRTALRVFVRRQRPCNKRLRTDVPGKLPRRWFSWPAAFHGVRFSRLAQSCQRRLLIFHRSLITLASHG